MIIDVHTRIWDSLDQLGSAADRLRQRRSEPWDRPAASADAHELAIAPVTAAFVLGFKSKLIGAEIPNQRIAEYVQRAPDRLVGFAGIDPMEPRPVYELETAIDMGLRGVVLKPAAQGFHPADSRAMPLYEACEARNVPVMFDTSTAMARDARMEFGQPALLDEVARSFPNLKILLGSLGYPWVDQGLTLVGKHPTVFAEVGELILQPWPLYNALLLAHQQGVMNQLFFGSHFPFCQPEKAIVTMYSVNTFTQGTHLPSIPREQLRSIVERDALTSLGLTLAPMAEDRQIETDKQSQALLDKAEARAADVDPAADLTPDTAPADDAGDSKAEPAQQPVAEDASK
ncbi:amidohydrolase family protein [Phycisphaerales bacterium AB-hyl4]|uniref:Amidohydrolase family protein n=1 Tax=Natronomicrosphaera hydrolytica TaxID=3242702 RepID=A0ABV4U3K2_9BACT